MNTIAKTRRLLSLALEPLEARELMTTVNFTINPSLDRQAISPYIYGANTYGQEAPLAGPYSNSTMARLGGNRWTAYNWENNASNAGLDWFYQNDAFFGDSNAPGNALKPTLDAAKQKGAATLVTVQMAGYVAADKTHNDPVGQPALGDVRLSPNYLQTRFNQMQPKKPGALSLNPNTADDFVYADEFVNFLKTTYPDQTIFYSLDNEPDLWAETHQEIHAAKATYAEMVSKGIAYSKAIKDVDPSAVVFGPASYGWYGYVALQGAPDGGGRDFLNYYLAEMKKADDAAGKRLLDVLDLHYYSNAEDANGRGTVGEGTTPAEVAARVQSPRSLWDPTYVEKSWITKDSIPGQAIQLIPRMEQKIAANYPGTKLALTEYHFGGGNHISGGIAQADALGIFGREGLFAADTWKLSGGPEPFIGGAFEMFRNFDGKNGSFGGMSVRAVTDNIVESSVYASVDPNDPNIITIVAINKTGEAIPAIMNLAGVAAGAKMSIYQLTGNSASPQAAGTATINNPAAHTYTMPAFSVSTLRIVRSNGGGGGGGGGGPTVSVADSSIVEGKAGQTAGLMTVFLNAPSNVPVVVDYATRDGSATAANNDYTPVSGRLVFAPGEMMRIVQVPVFGDTRVEGDEDLQFILSNPIGAVIGKSAATLTIQGDDIDETPTPELPVMSIANVSTTEGNSGTRMAIFTVSLNAPSEEPVTAKFKTEDGTATFAGGDYIAKEGTITFAPGQTKLIIQVPIKSDTLFESNERFTVKLSDAQNAGIITDTAIATIRNDDKAAAKPKLTFVKTAAWNTGFVGNVNIHNVTAKALKNQTIEFDFAGKITNLWNGTILSRRGNHYIIKPVAWTKTIPSGTTLTIGFVADPVGASVTPKNVRLNGALL